MHIIDTIEVALWKTKIRDALEEERQHALDEQELIILQSASVRLKIKIPDVLVRSTARIIP